VISLEWTDDEDMDSFMTEAVSPSGTTRYNTSAILGQDSNSHTASEYTHRRLQETLRHSVDICCMHVNNSPCCSDHVHNIEIEAQWMLDSGASRHFTFNMNDYIEFKSIPPVLARTANGSSQITRVGTVILIVGELVVRITDVYYIPDLNV
jgi:hypothetical protein